MNFNSFSITVLRNDLRNAQNHKNSLKSKRTTYAVRFYRFTLRSKSNIEYKLVAI